MLLIALSLLLTVAGCDDGEAPEPRQVPPSTGADAAAGSDALTQPPRQIATH